MVKSEILSENLAPETGRAENVFHNNNRVGFSENHERKLDLPLDFEVRVISEGDTFTLSTSPVTPETINNLFKSCIGDNFSPYHDDPMWGRGERVALFGEEAEKLARVLSKDSEMKRIRSLAGRLLTFDQARLHMVKDSRLPSRMNSDDVLRLINQGSKLDKFEAEGFVDRPKETEMSPDLEVALLARSLARTMKTHPEWWGNFKNRAGKRSKTSQTDAIKAFQRNNNLTERKSIFDEEMRILTTSRQVTDEEILVDRMTGIYDAVPLRSPSGRLGFVVLNENEDIVMDSGTEGEIGVKISGLIPTPIRITDHERHTFEVDSRMSGLIVPMLSWRKRDGKREIIEQPNSYIAPTEHEERVSQEVVVRHTMLEGSYSVLLGKLLVFSGTDSFRDLTTMSNRLNIENLLVSMNSARDNILNTPLVDRLEEIAD